jgi:hypothetical protein
MWKPIEGASLGDAQFRDFAEIAADWYWETGPDQRFSYLSPGIRRFGQDPAVRIGRRPIELATEADRASPKWPAHLAALDRQETFRNFVYRFEVGS